QYFNFYVTRSVEVLNSQEYRTQLNNPTTMTRLIMSEVFKDMTRTVCHQSFRVGRRSRSFARTSIRYWFLHSAPLKNVSGLGMRASVFQSSKDRPYPGIPFTLLHHKLNLLGYCPGRAQVNRFADRI